MKLITSVRFMMAFIVALLFIAIASAQIQSPLPAPTGPYSVGRTEFAWVDQSRPDPDSPSGHRELVVWVWYPASPKKGAESADWMPGKWGEHFVSNYLEQKAPKVTLPEIKEKLKKYPLDTIRAHSYPDAPIIHSKQKYPVLLFEPGLGEVPLVYSTVIEDLASHGYIVAGVVPTYYTSFTVFPDGREIVAQRTYPPPPPGSEKKTADDQRAVPYPGGKTIYLTREQEKAFRNERNHLIDVTIFNIWAEDMVFTLNQLEKLDANTKNQFHNRLDLKQVGVFGHSSGGGVGFQVAKDDARVKATLDLDGPLDGDVANGGLFKPLLLFLHPFTGHETYGDAVFHDGKPGYRLTLAGSSHGYSEDYGLMPFLPSAVKKDMQTGTIDPTRALTITKAYVEAFFDEYLEGKKSPLLNGPSPEYPEITFQAN